MGFQECSGEDDDSYLLAEDGSDDDSGQSCDETSSDNSEDYETLIRPYATLSPNQELIGVYGYFDTDGCISQIGLIAKEEEVSE